MTKRYVDYFQPETNESKSDFLFRLGKAHSYITNLGYLICNECVIRLVPLDPRHYPLQVATPTHAKTERCDFCPPSQFIVRDLTGGEADMFCQTKERAEAWVHHLTEWRPQARPVIINAKEEA